MASIYEDAEVDEDDEERLLSAYCFTDVTATALPWERYSQQAVVTNEPKAWLANPPEPAEDAPSQQPIPCNERRREAQDAARQTNAAHSSAKCLHAIVVSTKIFAGCEIVLSFPGEARSPVYRTARIDSGRGYEYGGLSQVASGQHPGDSPC